MFFIHDPLKQKNVDKNTKINKLLQSSAAHRDDWSSLYFFNESANKAGSRSNTRFCIEQNITRVITENRMKDT